MGSFFLKKMKNIFHIYDFNHYTADACLCLVLNLSQTK